ncbi:Hypothetical predicted protein [Scomber scombrus]|uniref:Uncharacterized protein n=1 Tax=Scomber scombrus TaxID=13677 RepID=A0AAV1Q781_SCOSC
MRETKNVFTAFVEELSAEHQRSEAVKWTACSTPRDCRTINRAPSPPEPLLCTAVSLRAERMKGRNPASLRSL